MENFEKELEILINKHSKENDSNTPDFILAEYLNNCLKTFNDALQKRAHWYGETGLPIDEKFIYKKPKMSFEDEAIMLENAASNHNFNNYCARATLGVCPPITPYNLLDMRTYTASERRAIKAVLESRNACCDVSRNAYDNWEIIMVMTNGCPLQYNIMSDIRKLGKIGSIDIYFDEYIEKNSFFFGWRGDTPQESGMIFVPYESMKDCEGVPLPDVNDPKEQGVLIKRGGVHFMIGSSEDFEDYKKALALYMKQQEINCFDNNMFNFIQKGI